MSAVEREDALPAAARRHDAVRFGAYMLRRFGWFYYALGLGFLFRHLTLDDASVERIRTADRDGTVVYVLLRRSVLDYLALNRVLNQRRLPLSVWADGITSFLWQPVVPAWRDLIRRVRAAFARGGNRDPVASGWLAEVVAAGAPVTLFVDDHRARPLFRRRPTADAFEAVIAASKRSERPVRLVPVVVVWDRAPDARGASAVRAWLEGSREAPRFLGRIRSVLLGRRDGFVQVGEPVDLKELCARVPPERQVKAARTLIRRYLRRESQVVRGPRLLPRSVMRKLVLDDPAMRELAEREARASGRTVAQVRQQMRRDFDRIAANFRWWVIRLLDVVLRPLWTRVFQGVDVRDEDMERIRAAMREGTAVLVPAHKSHFDYLLLSWVLYDHNLIVPHVVAGMNLAISGVAFFLRRAGGFFVQRSFHGDRIFPAVFARYLRELVHQGYPVEFFIEGGRTRSGKLLPPKYGVLGMVMDAAYTRRSGREVTVLPIALAYERVAEERAYVRELGGEAKKPESLGQLVRSASVLRRRFGRLYLRVGTPLPLGPEVDNGWRGLDDRERRTRLVDVGERIMHRIGRSTVVLPSSLVALGLLAQPARGVRQDVLWERVDRLRSLLRHIGAEESASLAHPSRALQLALDRFRGDHVVDDLEAASGERVWVIPVDQRIRLEFSKNQVLHYLAPAGLACLAIRALRDRRFDAEALLPVFCDLVWTFRREFILDPERPTSDVLADGLEHLVHHGAIAQADGAFSVVDPERIGEIYALFRNFPEAYVLVLRHGHGVIDGRRGRREAAKALQEDQETWVATGAVTRPESLSLVTLENALAVFTEEGVFVQDDDRRLALGDAALRDHRVAALAPTIDPSGNGT